MPLQNEDFLSASVRHYNDSNHLHSNGRLDNAAYLAGYVIECGLKAILQVYGHSAKAYGHDIAALQGAVLDLAMVLSPGSSRYCPGRLKSMSDIEIWKPGMRYHRTGILARADVERLMKAAREMFDSVVIEMLLDAGGL